MEPGAFAGLAKEDRVDRVDRVVLPGVGEMGQEEKVREGEEPGPETVQEAAPGPAT